MSLCEMAGGLVAPVGHESCLSDEGMVSRRSRESNQASADDAADFSRKEMLSRRRRETDQACAAGVADPVQVPPLHGAGGGTWPRRRWSPDRLGHLTLERPRCLPETRAHRRAPGLAANARGGREHAVMRVARVSPRHAANRRTDCCAGARARLSAAAGGQRRVQVRRPAVAGGDPRAKRRRRCRHSRSRRAPQSCWNGAKRRSCCRSPQSCWNGAKRRSYCRSPQSCWNGAKRRSYCRSTQSCWNGAKRRNCCKPTDRARAHYRRAHQSVSATSLR
jgi:hypothetical protein